MWGLEVEWGLGVVDLSCVGGEILLCMHLEGGRFVSIHNIPR